MYNGSSTLQELIYGKAPKDEKPFNTFDGRQSKIRPNLNTIQEWAIEGRDDQRTRRAPDTINPISPYDINPRIAPQNAYGYKHGQGLDKHIEFLGPITRSGSTPAYFETAPAPKMYSFMGE